MRGILANDKFEGEVKIRVRVVLANDKSAGGEV
jgi:hypothetical protein